MGNVNQPLTTAASSTSGSSSAPWPAAKQRLETGTVLLEFLLGGEVVNLDVDLHLHCFLFFRSTGGSTCSTDISTCI